MESNKGWPSASWAIDSEPIRARGIIVEYKLYRYVPPHRVRSLRRLCLKTGIHVAHFGLESSMAFEGTTGVYERIYRFNSK